MYYRIDSAFAPTLAQAQQFAAEGVREYGLYVPGARVYHASARHEFDIIRQAGMKPVFIHTGWDGNEAVHGAIACGAIPGDKVTLDVEAGWNDNYSQDWARTVKAQGFVTELYGLDSEVGAHGQVFDDQWIARYTYPQIPVPVGNHQAIQYENSHTEHGVGVDRSISNEADVTQTGAPVSTGGTIVAPFVVINHGDDPMTVDERKDVARAFTRLTYAAAPHRVPENQAAEDQLVPRAINDTVDGFDYLVRDLLGSTEFSADLQREQADLQEPAGQ